MICFIAMFAFGILAIFSARHRPVAKEAFDCVFRRVTLRKCESGLDKRLKGQITGKLMRKSPGMAKFLFRNFEAISWVFTILMVWSLVQTGISGYNYITYGNCNGKTNGEEFCVFDPAGTSKFSTSVQNYTGPLVFPGLGNAPKIGPIDAPVQIIEFGCYKCPYTKQAEAVMKQVISKYGEKVMFTYRDFPLSESHGNVELHSLAARCADEQEKYWEYRDYLFSRQQDMDHTQEGMVQLAADLGLDKSAFSQCLSEERYMNDILDDARAGVMAGIYGTPTFFINNKTIVGPRDLSVFSKVIDKELKAKGIT